MFNDMLNQPLVMTHPLTLPAPPAVYVVIMTRSCDEMWIGWTDWSLQEE